MPKSKTYSTGQTWGALRKAWRGYEIARVNKNHEKQRKYASLIQQLEHDLGLNITYNFRGLSQNFRGNLLDCDFRGKKSDTRKSSPKKKSPKRKSSPKKKSPKRKSSPKKKSPKRKSRSPKRRSSKRKSRSPKRRSSRRKSRSPKRRSSKRKSSPKASRRRTYAKFSPNPKFQLRGRK